MVGHSEPLFSVKEEANMQLAAVVVTEIDASALVPLPLAKAFTDEVWSTPSNDCAAPDAWPPPIEPGSFVMVITIV